MALEKNTGTFLSRHQLQTLNLFAKAFLDSSVPEAENRKQKTKYISPLVFYLKSQVKRTSIKHPKLNRISYEWRLMLPLKMGQ